MNKTFLFENCDITLSCGISIGDTVEVVAICDETGDPNTIGTTGVVTAFDYGAGCGESYPDDPMIMVNGYAFWKEELKKKEG